MQRQLFKRIYPETPERESRYQREVHRFRVRSLTFLGFRFCALMKIGYDLRAPVHSGISRNDVARELDMRPAEVTGAIELALNCEMPRSTDELFGSIVWASVHGAFDDLCSWIPTRENSPDPITKFILQRYDVFNDALIAYRQRIASGNPMPLGFVEHHLKMHLGRVARKSNYPGMAASLYNGLRVKTVSNTELATIIMGYRDQLMTLDLTQRLALDAVELARSRRASRVKSV